MEQVLEKEASQNASPGYASSSPHDLQGDVYMNSQIDTILDWLQQNQIVVPQPSDVRRYLLRYTDILELISPVCTAAKTSFENRAKLSLEVYHDPEIADEYLALFIRQKAYDNEILKRIRQISKDLLYQQLANRSGWFTVTTDFKYAA
jgi:hypothetical protein